MKTILFTEDILDVRDIIARFEELESEVQEEIEQDLEDWSEEREEFEELQKALDELRGNGGDEEWRGDWYPVVLISNDYFAEYAEQFASDVGAIDRNANWPLNHIDWTAAAEDLKNDYTSVTLQCQEYWYR